MMRDEYEDEDLRWESIAERRRMNHWCDLCHGHTGAGSPCGDDYDDPEEEAYEDDDAS